MIGVAGSYEAIVDSLIFRNHATRAQQSVPPLGESQQLPRGLFGACKTALANESLAQKILQVLLRLLGVSVIGKMHQSAVATTRNLPISASVRISESRRR